MTTTADYGTWNNRYDHSNTSVEATIADAVNGGDSDWREAMEAAGAFKRIADAYRNAINDALPHGVSLAGNDFYGPYYEADMDFDGYQLNKDGALDIAGIIEDIDLYEIIERYDVVALVDEARKAAATAAAVTQEATLARAAAIARVVKACDGNQREAARHLGIDPSRVNRLVAKSQTVIKITDQVGAKVADIVNVFGANTSENVTMSSPWDALDK